MNRLFAATMALQQPEAQPREAGGAPPAYQVCPHCKREIGVYLEFCDGRSFDVHRCCIHGDVIPILSAIRNICVEDKIFPVD